VELGRITAKAVDQLWTRHLELAEERRPDPDTLAAIRDLVCPTQEDDLYPTPPSPYPDIPRATADALTPWALTTSIDSCDTHQLMLLGDSEPIHLAPPHDSQDLTAGNSIGTNGLPTKEGDPYPTPTSPHSAIPRPPAGALTSWGPPTVASNRGYPRTTAKRHRPEPPLETPNLIQTTLTTTGRTKTHLGQPWTVHNPALQSRGAKRNRLALGGPAQPPATPASDTDVTTLVPKASTAGTQWTHPLTRLPLRPSAKRYRPSTTADGAPLSQRLQPPYHSKVTSTSGTHCSDLVRQTHTSPPMPTGHKRLRNPLDCAAHHEPRPAPPNRKPRPDITQLGRPTTLTLTGRKRPSEQLAPPPEKRPRDSPLTEPTSSIGTVPLLVQPDPPPRRIWDPRLGDDDG
jgi:hypothetical protein